MASLSAVEFIWKYLSTVKILKPDGRLSCNRPHIWEATTTFLFGFLLSFSTINRRLTLIETSR